MAGNEVLPGKNGLFHLPSLADGLDNHIEPTPLFFSTFVLDYKIVLDPAPPASWIYFINQLWPEDPDCINTLQEFMGNFLTQDTKYQKVLMLIGPKRSGKGTIAKIVTGLIGQKNVAGPTLSSLKTNFGLQPFLDKQVAIFSDARLKSHDDSVVERLLSISGEDLLTIDCKYREPVSARLKTRLVIITNELPRFSDPSGALPNRMIILPLKVSFSGREDPDLGARLLKELPGILLWAIEGWRRLNERQRFIQPEAGLAVLTELEDLSNPVGQFVKECCRLDSPLASIARQELYDKYNKWCCEQGINRPLAPNTFGHHLRAYCHSIRDKHATIGGKRVWCYEGITLKS